MKVEATTPSPPSVPERLRDLLADRYDIKQPIGRGGMATVYLAKDLRHDRLVAVKVLHPELAALSGLPERFHREIRIAARLTHPNILPVHDSGEADGYLYFVMPFLGCESLRQRITREGRLSIDQALRITSAIASALDYAHRQQVIHRDVKPENIMLVEGQPVVADFGIARALTDTRGERLTVMGVVIGTPAYMSPEQASGDEVDGRSDQYSLACVAYEMLVGHTPFPGGSSRNTLARHIIEEPAPLVSERSTIPPATEWAIMKALAKEPDARFATATEFAEALNRSAPRPDTTTLTASFRDVRAIAVLPFVNASPDPEDEYLSDGLTEELINALAQVEGLHVAPRTTVFARKGKVTDVREAGAKLGVTFLLEGVVRRSGQRLRITAQLVNGLDGRLLWSSRYDRDSQEVFAVQEEIARTIVMTLRGTVLGDLGDPLPDRATKNPKAYHLYLRGRHAWAARQGAEGVKEAIGYFEQAIAEDPDYALAYTGLSDCYALLLDYRGVPVREGMERAKAEALRALALDDSLAEAHTSLAWVHFIYEWDWSAAEGEFRRAIELDPRYATARQWYAWLLMALNRVEESLMQARLAVELDPASVSIRRSLGWLYSMARQPEAAIAYLRRTVALDPTAEESYRVLGMAYLQKGLFDEARLAFEEALAMLPDTAYAMAGLSATHARAGRRDEADRLLSQLHELSGKRYVSPVAFAMACAAQGDADKTFVWLEKAYEERRGWMTYLRVEPMLDPIRGDPRFADWLRRMKLE
jgi:serine/threonine protein kinase/tetratricopeptide (TPR) repeat protein